jgi:hypothetical protein
MLMSEPQCKPCNSIADHDIVAYHSAIMVAASPKCARSSAGQSAWLRTRRSGVRSPPGVPEPQGFTVPCEAFFRARWYMSSVSELSNTYKVVWRISGGSGGGLLGGKWRMARRLKPSRNDRRSSNGQAITAIISP